MRTKKITVEQKKNRNSQKSAKSVRLMEVSPVTFCNAFHISVTGKVSDFKFGGLAYHSMSEPVSGKPSLKGAWLESRDQF